VKYSTVLGSLALLGIVVAVDYGKQHPTGRSLEGGLGDRFEFDLEVAPKPVPPMPESASATVEATSACTPRTNLRSASPVRENAKGWNRNRGTQADGPGFRRDRAEWRWATRFIRRAALADSRLSLDLGSLRAKEILATIRNEKGDIQASWIWARR
jgi:hypothetical protein